MQILHDMQRVITIPATLFVGHAETKIVGGSVTDITSFPFMLSLRFLTAHVCGATAISPTVVVTAAHCLDGGIPTFVVSNLRALHTSCALDFSQKVKNIRNDGNSFVRVTKREKQKIG